MKVGLLLGAHNSLPHHSDSLEHATRREMGHRRKYKRGQRETEEDGKERNERKRERERKR